MHRKLIPTTLVLLGLASSWPATASAAPLTFDEGRGTIEVVERLRWEDRSNNFDFDANAHSPTDDSWWVQRLRLGATWNAAKELSFQFQLQDAREWASERPKVPFILGAEGNDPLDLRLAAVTFGNPKTSPVVFTVGRQTLVMGDERLVGIGEWNNFARTFDAGKLVWTLLPAKTVATFFVGSVVNVQPTTSGGGWKFDHSSSNDMLSGANLSQKLTPTDTAEVYLLWRDKKDNNPIYTAPTAAIPAPARTAAAYDIGQDIYTLGGRFIRVPKPGLLDYEAEGAVQWGKVNRQTTAATGNYAGLTPQLDQRAWALHTLVGYTLPGAAANVRFDAEYNVASGDTNRNDNRNESFMNLFPSNHKWYGFMDLFSWKNLRETVATVRYNPLPQFTTRIDYHVFSLYSSQDAWYRANGVATVRPLTVAAQSAPTHAGDELDLTATWTPKPWVTLDLGWSRFFAGPYLGATGARSDGNFVYAQTTLKY